MSADLSVAPWAATGVGLVPLLWLAGQREQRPFYWWLAVALGVSCIADVAAYWVHLHGGSTVIVSTVYPVSQAALIGAVFLPRYEAWTFTQVLVSVALVGLILGDAAIALDTVAWLGVAAIVSRQRTPVQSALLMIFGVGWFCWMGYNLAPGWATWGVYQAARAIGTALFCVAAWHPAPKLRLA